MLLLLVGWRWLATAGSSEVEEVGRTASVAAVGQGVGGPKGEDGSGGIGSELTVEWWQEAAAG